MNIDRPLEEIILEKRKQQRESFKNKKRTRKPKAKKDGTEKDASGDVKMVDAAVKKKSKTIKKKRKSQATPTKGKLAKSKEMEIANGILDDAMKSFQENPSTSNETQKKSKPTSSGGTKITVTNLDPGVTNIDVSELFGAVGPLRRALVVYDKNGRSTGIAEVVFENSDAALEAIKKYNGVPLDNRPLQISLATGADKSSSGTARRGNANKDSSKPSGFWGNDNEGSIFGNSSQAKESNPFNTPLDNEYREQRGSRGGRGGYRGGRGNGRGRYYGGRRRNFSRDTVMQI